MRFALTKRKFRDRDDGHSLEFHDDFRVTGELNVGEVEKMAEIEADVEDAVGFSSE